MRLQRNWRNQAISLKFRLLSVRVASGPSVSNRKMSIMAMLQQVIAIHSPPAMRILHMVRAVTNDSWLQSPSRCPIQV